MSSLRFLLLASACLVLYHGFLHFYEMVDEFPDTCSCFCTDVTMSFPDMTSKVEYRGYRRHGMSCDCEDFLVHRLEQSMMAINENETCQMCKCSSVSESHCKDGVLTFRTMFTIASITIWTITSVLFLFDRFNSYCVLDKKSRVHRSGRSGYQRILDQNEAEELLKKGTSPSNAVLNLLRK
ncbi:uncharacterized protein CDAR_467981 [Caerostris darwini]|uniref:Uncharacterized protein n=1 Tax=Caerostris darwini TaxID=1538125 RepID=A0AAV4WYL8_9ARAC|nr:uncharacterized protein CDAR_467981 [Caerostris darwini]